MDPGFSASLSVIESVLFSGITHSTPPQCLQRVRLVDICSVTVETTALQRLFGHATLVVYHRTMTGLVEKLTLRCPALQAPARAQYLRTAKKWATIKMWAKTSL